MSDPERTPVPIRRAVPVKGPGIAEHIASESFPAETIVYTGKQQEEPKRRAGKPDAQQTNAEQPAVGAAADRRHLVVDLDTVMAMLDCVKPGERSHLKEIIYLFSQLTPTARMRVLKVINRIFQ